MDMGFDGQDRIDEAERFFTARKNNAQYSEIEHLKKENLKLLELISNLQKDGYTYDQLTRKMIVCESCAKQLKANQ